MSDIRENLKCSGVNDSEVCEKRKTFGFNTIEVKDPITGLSIFARQFKSIFILILFLAGLLSLFLGELSDAIAIIVILIFNATLGFIQEWKAEKALESLKDLLTPKAKVIRNGKSTYIARSELVPGDVVLLEAGGQVPADLIIIEGADGLEVDESILTGESLPVSKHCAEYNKEPQESGKLWMGTMVTQGACKAKVSSTGEKTRFGQVSDLTSKAKKLETPLSRSLSRLGYQIGYLALFIGILVFLVGWLRGQSFIETTMVSLSLVVALVPEGLPLVVTLSLAFGVYVFVKKGVIVRKLQSVEALGRVSSICTDKTGTITVNQMTVTRLWTPEVGDLIVSGLGYSPLGHFYKEGLEVKPTESLSLKKLLECGYLCNRSHIFEKNNEFHVDGSPTEGALLALSKKGKIKPLGYKKKHEIPFSSERKKMSVIFENDSSQFEVFTKGAVEVLLDSVSFYLHSGEEKKINDIYKEAILSKVEEMGSLGLRVILLCGRKIFEKSPSFEASEIEKNMILYGIVGLMDPPRAEVSEAIGVCMNSGVNVSVITGDAQATACAISKEIGLVPGKTISGYELDGISDHELSQILERRESVLYYRTQPQHKLRIVKAQQAIGEVVAMTGDGVNDAPALKASDVGVSMGKRGTDVAKGASDIILMDDSFSTLVKGIREGRREFDNIQKFILYLLSSNVGEVVAVFGSLFLKGPLILSAIQILWVNLVTDGISALSLSFEKEEKDIMDKDPRDVKESFLNKKGITLLSIVGSYIGLATLGIFYFYLSSDDIRMNQVANSVSFSTLVFLELVNLFNFQSLKESVFSERIFTNKKLIWFSIATFVVHLICLYSNIGQYFLKIKPLNWVDWGRILLISLPIIFIVEFRKFLFRKERLL